MGRAIVTGPNAGSYELVMFGIPTRFERAWHCSACGVSWYDGGRKCVRCGEATGEPEALPAHIKILKDPSN